MSEKSLNDPLCGSEIKAILLNEIEKRLNGDSTLLDDLAYAGFTAKFDIKISYLRSLTQPTLVWGTATADTGAESAPAGDTAISDTYVSPAPNVARSENNLPIPVLIQTPAGPRRQRVQIERVRPK